MLSGLRLRYPRPSGCGEVERASWPLLLLPWPFPVIGVPRGAHMLVLPEPVPAAFVVSGVLGAVFLPHDAAHFAEPASYFARRRTHTHIGRMPGSTFREPLPRDHKSALCGNSSCHPVRGAIPCRSPPCGTVALPLRTATVRHCHRCWRPTLDCVSSAGHARLAAGSDVPPLASPYAGIAHGPVTLPLRPSLDGHAFAPRLRFYHDRDCSLPRATGGGSARRCLARPDTAGTLSPPTPPRVHCVSDA